MKTRIRIPPSHPAWVEDRSLQLEFHLRNGGSRTPGSLQLWIWEGVQPHVSLHPPPKSQAGGQTNFACWEARGGGEAGSGVFTGGDPKSYYLQFHFIFTFYSWSKKPQHILTYTHTNTQSHTNTTDASHTWCRVQILPSVFIGRKPSLELCFIEIKNTFLVSK